MSIGSFWQHVESKNCYPQSALEFWKKEHRREKGEREVSKKLPMDDSEALSEKKLRGFLLGIWISLTLFFFSPLLSFPLAS